MLSFRNVQIRSIKLLSLMLQIIREATPYKQKFLLKNKNWPILERNWCVFFVHFVAKMEELFSAISSCCCAQEVGFQFL